MNMKLQASLIAVLCSSPLYADGYYPEPMSADQPWVVTASVGTGQYESMSNNSSKTILGRLALGNELMLTGDLAWGLELGVQNGNEMHLTIPNDTLTLLDWPPVRTDLGAMFDLLVTAKSDPLAGSSFFAQFKGGLAYRKWRVERHDINDVSQLAAEFQAGLGYPITTLASLNLLYQGVFGNDPLLALDVISRTGHLTNIPTLHAILLGFSINI
jgi:hypothetical protein